jgi:hypothetical protein
LDLKAGCDPIGLGIIKQTDYWPENIEVALDLTYVRDDRTLN